MKRTKKTEKKTALDFAKSLDDPYTYHDAPSLDTYHDVIAQAMSYARLQAINLCAEHIKHNIVMARSGMPAEHMLLLILDNLEAFKKSL